MKLKEINPEEIIVAMIKNYQEYLKEFNKRFGTNVTIELTETLKGLMEKYKTERVEKYETERNELHK